MKKIALVAIAAATMAFAGGDIATVETPVTVEKTGIYAGVAYTYGDVGIATNEWFDGEIGTANAVSFAVGYNVIPNLAVEARYSYITEDAFAAFPVEVDGSVWSVFAKPQYGFDNGVVVYGLLGLGQVELNDVYTETTFQYGAGLAYNIDADYLVFADYTRLADDADFAGIGINVDALNVGVAYKF